MDKPDFLTNPDYTIGQRLAALYLLFAFGVTTKEIDGKTYFVVVDIPFGLIVWIIIVMIALFI